MAKGAYIGAPLTDVMTSNNIGSWFTLSDPDGISSWSGTTLTVTGISSNERVKLTALRDMTVSFDYTTDSFCKISFKGQYICDNGDDGHYTATLEAGKYFYFSNSSAVSSQTCKFTNITCTSATSVAHKIKKGYVGVDDKARKIKKAYIGIGGVARPCWSGGELAYYGTITSLSAARYQIGSGYNANYAVFAGGQNKSGSNATYLTTVEAYDKNLTRSSASALSANAGRTFQSGGAGNVGDYAVFAGGSTSRVAWGYAYSYVEAYDLNLTHSTAAELHGGTGNHCSASTDNYFMVAFGQTYPSSSGYWPQDVQAYNKSLTKTTTGSNFSESRSLATAGSVGATGVFAGGASASNVKLDKVEACDGSLTIKTGLAALSHDKWRHGSASSDKYVLFGGGQNQSGISVATVDAYNSSLTKTKLTNLSVARYRLDGAYLDGFYLFMGGYDSAVVDAYDESLTKVSASNLSSNRYGFGYATVGNYVVICGGYNNPSAAVTTAEAFTVA